MNSKKDLLEKRKKELMDELAVVNEKINKIDLGVYKGKFQKAIKLLDEYYTDYASYPEIILQCEECKKDIGFGLGEVLDGLERLCREEFGS